MPGATGWLGTQRDDAVDSIRVILRLRRRLRLPASLSQPKRGNRRAGGLPERSPDRGQGRGGVARGTEVTSWSLRFVVAFADKFAIDCRELRSNSQGLTHFQDRLRPLALS
jgi:hypothetical protein